MAEELNWMMINGGGAIATTERSIYQVDYQDDCYVWEVKEHTRRGWETMLAGIEETLDGAIAKASAYAE